MRANIKESYKAQNTIIKALEKALEDLQVIHTYKERLRKQIDLLNYCVEKAVIVEKQGSLDCEKEESKTILFNSYSKQLTLTLLPSIQSTFKGLLFKYQETPNVALFNQLSSISLTTASS